MDVCVLQDVTPSDFNDLLISGKKTSREADGKSF